MNKQLILKEKFDIDFGTNETVNSIENEPKHETKILNKNKQIFGDKPGRISGYVHALEMTDKKSFVRRDKPCQ